jgi:isoleucyl-tRNA synthetase
MPSRTNCTLLVSQVQMVDSPEAAAAAEHSASVVVEGVGEVTVGVTRADGAKCSRCWNYSVLVGSDAEHPELCERCSPVIRAMGFKAPAAAVAEEAAAAV